MSDDDDTSPENPGLKKTGLVKKRLIESSLAIADDDPESFLFQHTVFCQIGLPYRDPGDDTRLWERINGKTHLKVIAGEAMHPEKGRLVPLGLPWGAKPRLILAHLNAEALRQSSPVIAVEDSLTAFVRRVRHFQHGREIRMFKDQLSRLCASSVRLGILCDGRAVTINSQIVTAFDLWFPKDERQRVLWPSTIKLSEEYYGSLQHHAVPLDERAVCALSHSAMAMDIYCWLSQRLHRIDHSKPQFVPWAALKAQFGAEHSRMNNFKAKFRIALEQVQSQYRDARFELDGRGMTLFHSPPPVKSRMVVVTLPPDRAPPSAALPVIVPQKDRAEASSLAAIDRMRGMPAFKGWDVRWLQAAFDAWLAKPGKAKPRDYDAALIAWARKYVANHPLPS